MILEIPCSPEAVAERSLSVVRFGSGWAIKHGEGYLGHARAWEEALTIVHALQTMTTPAGVRPGPAAP